MSKTKRFIVMIDNTGCGVRIDTNGREWSHDEDENLVRATDYDALRKEKQRLLDVVKLVHKRGSLVQTSDQYLQEVLNAVNDALENVEEVDI